MRNRIHPERGSSAAAFESSPGFTNVQEAWPASESAPNTPDRVDGGPTPRGKPTARPQQPPMRKQQSMAPQQQGPPPGMALDLTASSPRPIQPVGFDSPKRQQIDALYREK